MVNAEKDPAHTAVDVHVKAAEAPRLRVGTRWEVVASSLGSLWEDTYTITLKEINAADEPA